MYLQIYQQWFSFGDVLSKIVLSRPIKNVESLQKISNGITTIFSYTFILDGIL